MKIEILFQQHFPKRIQIYKAMFFTLTTSIPKDLVNRHTVENTKPKNSSI